MADARPTDNAPPSDRRTIPVPVLAVTILVLLGGGIALGLVRAGDDSNGKAAPATTTAAPAPTTTAPPLPRISFVAQAIVPGVAVFSAPGAPQPDVVLPNPQPSGAPLVFLVRTQQAEWLNVLLPTPPVGSTGWIRTPEVSLVQHDYEIVVELAAHRLSVLKSGQPLVQAPVALGKANPPPPGNAYYVKELLQFPPDTVYGPYAFGLSGFVNQVSDLAAGKGVTGVHGTDDPDELGSDLKTGSIATANETITVMAVTVPLGTPVDVRP